jgi:hypothetical protein
MSDEEQKSPRRIPVSGKRMRMSEDGTNGVLLGRKCQECGATFFGAPRFCVRCTSGDLRDVELSTEGTLYTYTIPHLPAPGWQGPVPYIIGSVKLPEGPSVTSEIVDCRQEDVKIGMPLELTLRVGGKDKEGNEIVVYKWKPKAG